MGNSKEQIEKLDANTAAFYKKITKKRGRYEFYSLPDDEPLTEEEIAAIDAYWSKYKFVYPIINYASFQAFKNRCGHFDVRHCPGTIYNLIHPNFINKKYLSACRNKALMDYLYPDMQKPLTVCRRMSGIYYDENYMPIELDQLIDICCAHVKNVGNLILKPGGEHGGTGITILTKENTSADLIKKILLKDLKNQAVVIQEVLKQSPFMDKLNASSVNTIRIVTILINGKVHPLAALIRVGKKGSAIDNWHAGGCLLGIDIKTGKCNDWALAPGPSHITVLPSGVDLKAEELVVPNFEMLKERVTRAHYRLPYMKTIFWDIALDQNNIPTFIECNFHGEMHIHEAVTGPFFGEFSDEIYDEYLLKKHYFRFATEDFVCREYHDHIEIETYAGDDGMVVIHNTLRDKPVTAIRPKAFEGKIVTNISASLEMIDMVQKTIEASKS